jgi:hypothetical protein
MPDPSKYQRGYSFSGYQATNPKQPLPASRVDDEFENIAQKSGEVVDAIKDIRRSDGKLKNEIVTRESLHPLVAMFLVDLEAEAEREADRAADEAARAERARDIAVAAAGKKDTILPTVEHAGAEPGRFVSDAQAAANTVAFQKALDDRAALGGGTVYALSQFYVLSGPIRIPSGVSLEGSGVDEWEPIFPARPKRWQGTSVIFIGNGAENVSFHGVTSAEHGGGWRQDPDNPGQYFKLTPFTDRNAAGSTPATPRLFSVAVMNKPGAQYIGVKNLRIVNACGADRISGHSDRNSTDLGAAWDIGLCLKNSEYALIENVQVVGTWREFAHLEITEAINESRSERNRRERCKFQGRVGVGIRAPDRWRVTALAANSVSIYFSAESYWPASGTFRGSNNQTYTYTGTSQVGSTFTFTGVTPDPASSGIFQVRHPSAGFGNGEYQDCYIYGLDHVSGSKAHTLGIADSKPLEVSGYPLRGLKFRNFKTHTGEKTILHLHDGQDLTFEDPQVEGGGHLIATPDQFEADDYCAAPCGETRHLLMDLDTGVAEMDLRLFTPRSGFVQGLQLAPRSNLTGDLPLRPLRSGRSVLLQDFDGNTVLDPTVKTWTPSFRYANAPAYTVQTGRYVKVGSFIFFELKMEWSGLDVADTSGVSIVLPVNPDPTYGVDGTVQERTSTGINLSSLTRPYLDIAGDNISLAITHNRATRVSYNTVGVMQAAGALNIIGKYRAL